MPDDDSSRPYTFEDPEAEAAYQAAFGKNRRRAVRRATDWRTRRAQWLHLLGWFVRPVVRWFWVLALVLLWLTNQIGLFTAVVLTVVGVVVHAGLGSAWFRSVQRLQDDIEDDLQSRYPSWRGGRR